MSIKINHDVKDLKGILFQFVFTISETHEPVHACAQNFLYRKVTRRIKIKYYYSLKINAQ